MSTGNSSRFCTTVLVVARSVQGPQPQLRGKQTRVDSGELANNPSLFQDAVKDVREEGLSLSGGWSCSEAG